ncbi:MAG: hypothetical protein ACI9FN_003655 [Saprospiraceae bacterium]|jgi:hypothetical protein
MYRIALFIVIILGILSCEDKMDCETEFDTPFVAEVGEEYCFPDGAVLLISEFSTSYCPCNASCVWQGETVVLGSWIDASGKATALMIHEVLKDQNLPWIQIHDIGLNEACEPTVQTLELIITDPNEVLQCDELVQINDDAYDKGPKDFINIVDASLEGDCLTIFYSASGCSGDSWEVNLYDSGAVAESEPEQRYLRLSMMNPEACLAVFTKERSFDISDLQIENNGVLILNLLDSEESLRYKY